MLGAHSPTSGTASPRGAAPRRALNRVAQSRGFGAGSVAQPRSGSARTRSRAPKRLPRSETAAGAQAFGDNDPVDIVEIGSAPIARGAVVQARRGAPREPRDVARRRPELS